MKALEYVIPIIGVIVMIGIIVWLYFRKARNNQSKMENYISKNQKAWIKHNQRALHQIRGVVTNDATQKFYFKTSGEIHDFCLSVHDYQLGTYQGYSFVDKVHNEKMYTKSESLQPLKTGTIAVTNKAVVVRTKGPDKFIFFYQIKNLFFIDFKLKTMMGVVTNNDKTVLLYADNDDLYYYINRCYQNYLLEHNKQSEIVVGQDLELQVKK